nr:PREDICTED: jerky protein homolog-like isoform X1 [Tribolium castaneum]XP_015833732.1 PREDICTED: jerky protein homolog-like isoform X2 [Tribolium castaneum]|eukprot:XP_015833731.1 PREDICTED: jerky protein homolog-like isoform X1 [Tribolium castaneum]
MSKRKRVVLTFQQKLEILQQLNEGTRGSVLAKQYGIGTSTISDIKRNADAILKFVSNLDCENQISEKKTRKTAQNTDLDSLIHRWYLEERKKGGVPLDATICAKALEINSQLRNGNQSFKASSGWLRHFKNRHGIKDKEANDEEPVNVGKQLRNFFKRGGFTHESIYNVCDSVLLWKSLPNCDKKSAVKIIACANANSAHKLPLCVVGPERRCATNDAIFYKHQSPENDSTMFEEWFEDIFVPLVTQRQQNTGNVGKILLVMNDSLWHPPRETLVKDRDNFEVFVVPEDSLTQPMDLVMNQLKTSYRKHLLELLLSKSPCPVKQFLEEFALTESISVISKAWDFIPRTDIVQSWTRLISDVRNETELNHDGIVEIVAIARKITGLEETNSMEITQWLESDKEFCYDSIEYEEFHFDDEVTDEPSNIEAYQSLETAIRWFRNQNECNNVQLATLENLRDLAAAKVCVKRET